MKWYLSAIEKTKGELIYVYCKQEEKRPPKTKRQIKAFHDYIFDKTEFDINKLDKAEKNAQEKIIAHPARFVEQEKA